MNLLKLIDGQRKAAKRLNDLSVQLALLLPQTFSIDSGSVKIYLGSDGTVWVEIEEHTKIIKITYDEFLSLTRRIRSIFQGDIRNVKPER